MKLKESYPSFEHFFFIKSNNFMATPHLSGVVCFGQTVTDGKVSSSIGYVIVSSMVMVGLSYQTEKYQANFNSNSNVSIIDRVNHTANVYTQTTD